MTLVRNRMTSFLLQNTIEDTLKNVDNWTSLTQNHISETFLKISIALQRTMNHTQILNTTRLSKWQNVYFWMNWIKHNRYQKSSPFNDLVTTSVRSRKKAGEVYSENLPLSIRWGFNRCLFTASSLLRTISQTYRHRRKTMSKYAEHYSVFETKSPKQCERKQRAHPPPHVPSRRPRASWRIQMAPHSAVQWPTLPLAARVQTSHSVPWTHRGVQ